MQVNQEIEEILKRINDGKATSEDKRLLDEWYQQFDDTAVSVHMPSDYYTLKQSIWQRVSKQLFPQSIISIRKIYIGGAVAASLLLGVFFIKKYQSTSYHMESSLHIVDESGQKQAIFSSIDDFLDSSKYVDLTHNRTFKGAKILHTRKKELIKFILPDGTKVSLNSNSKIQLKEGFGKTGNRILYLEGEAYFDVAKIPNQSFIVRTKDQQIEVLGTKFNVRAYPHQKETITSLYEGKIKLLTAHQNLLVDPNETVVNTGESLSKENKDLNISAAWRNMQFSFEEEHIEDVIYRLADWYGLQVYLQNAAPDQKITGELEQGMSLKDVLVVLEKLTDATYQLVDNKLTVHFKK